MIKLSVSGLSEEQRDTLLNVLTSGHFTRGVPADAISISKPTDEGTYSVTVTGRDNAARLAFVLTDEDSGADYLV
jgi:hypothetical protein